MDFCAATAYQHLKCVETLLQFGADVNIRNNNGNAPINIAINLGCMDIVSRLAPLCQESILIQLLEDPSLQGRLQKLNLLIACNKNTGKLDGFFNRYLPYIVKNGQIEMFGILLPACKNQNLQNEFGASTLHIAVKKYAEVFQIPQGIVNAVHLIRAENTFRNMIHALVSSADNLDCQDSYGYTPLHLAVENGLLEIVMMLIPFYKDLNMETKKGETSIQIARRRKDDAMVELLDEEIANRARCFGF